MSSKFSSADKEVLTDGNRRRHWNRVTNHKSNPNQKLCEISEKKTSTDRQYIGRRMTPQNNRNKKYHREY